MLRRFDTEGLPADVASVLQGKGEWAYTIARDDELKANLRTFHNDASTRDSVVLNGVEYAEHPLFSALADDGTLLAARTRQQGRNGLGSTTYAVLLGDIRSPRPHRWQESEAMPGTDSVEVFLSAAERPPLLTLLEGNVPFDEKVALFAEAQIVADAERRHARRIRLTHFCIELLQNGYEHVPTQSTEELLNEIALLALKGVRPDSDRGELLTFSKESDTM